MKDLACCKGTQTRATPYNKAQKQNLSPSKSFLLLIMPQDNNNNNNNNNIPSTKAIEEMIARDTVYYYCNPG
jgi:hypothetical protein